MVEPQGESGMTPFPEKRLCVWRAAVATMTGERSVWRTGVWIIQGNVLNGLEKKPRTWRAMSDTAAYRAFRIWRQ